MEEEIWKDIEGFEGLYQVSNLGRVKSLVRPYRRTEKIITATPNTAGYLIVGLRRPGSVKSMLVHRLVMQAFEPIDNSDEMSVNHKDFNITNNRLENLEWCTYEYNLRHSYDTGLFNKAKISGENNHEAKLTWDDVAYIREYYIPKDRRFGQRAMARKFGVSRPSIRRVLSGDGWRE